MIVKARRDNMKKSFLVVIYILFAVCACSGEEEQSSQDNTKDKMPPREIKASVYWSHFAQGRLAELELKEGPPGYLSGYKFNVDAGYDFILAKEALNDPQQKTAGYFSACFETTWLIPRNFSPKSFDHLPQYEIDKVIKNMEDAKALIKKYTGQDFQTREEAQAWLEENRPYLKFSEEKGMLILVKSEQDK
jgi:hypothetical protein